MTCSPQSIEPPSDARWRLHAITQLGHPDGELLDQLERGCEWLLAPAGSRIFSEGDPADGMYILLDGRVRLVIESAPLDLEVWEIDGVSAFGEGALLTGGGRSRTAVAVRDSSLVRLSPPLFELVLRTMPGVAVEIAQRVALRTVFPRRSQSSATPTSTHLALVSITMTSEELDPWLQASVGALGDGDTVTVSGRAQPSAIAAARHADRVVIVVDAGRPVDVEPALQLIREGLDPLATPTIDVLIVHRDGAAPRATSGWLRTTTGVDHLHVRRGSAADLARFARHVGRRSVGLVLGGGGARGFAHIGVVRALEELGIPIDSVGGSSMGAVLGGQVAMGWTWEEMLERNARLWGDRRLRWEFSVPTVSLYSGRRALRIFDETFGSCDIEDFWLPFFCTSVDLSCFCLSIHRHGPAAQWIRASATVAGLWPPVVDQDGHLHIDGGQLDNIPTEHMAAHNRGPIVAVDLFAKQAEMTLAPGTSPSIGARHLLRRRDVDRLPTIVETLNRCALLGSLAAQQRAHVHADVYITPDLGEIGFSRFDRMRDAADVGYEAAMRTLSSWTPWPVRAGS